MRGDLYRLAGRKDQRGHEQRGGRYAVIVQSDTLPLSTVLVAPTTTGSFPASFHPTIDIDGVAAMVLVEQTAAVDPGRLGAFAGRLSASELADVDRALHIVLGMF